MGLHARTRSSCATQRHPPAEITVACPRYHFRLLSRCFEILRQSRPEEAPAMRVRIEPDAIGKQFTDHSLRDLAALLQEPQASPSYVMKPSTRRVTLPKVPSPRLTREQCRY